VRTAKRSEAKRTSPGIPPPEARSGRDLQRIAADVPVTAADQPRNDEQPQPEVHQPALTGGDIVGHVRPLGLQLLFQGGDDDVLIGGRLGGVETRTGAGLEFAKVPDFVGGDLVLNFGFRVLVGVKALTEQIRCGGRSAPRQLEAGQDDGDGFFHVKPPK